MKYSRGVGHIPVAPINPILPNVGRLFFTGHTNLNSHLGTNQRVATGANHPKRPRPHHKRLKRIWWLVLTAPFRCDQKSKTRDHRGSRNGPNQLGISVPISEQHFRAS
jgi:hypothetical protein